MSDTYEREDPTFYLPRNERYNPAWCPKRTFGQDGREYRSGHEARCANAMFRNGIPYEYEAKSYPMPQLPGGYYTPDFIIPDPYVPGGEQVAEATGSSSDKKVASGKAFRSKADDPNDAHHVSSFVEILTDKVIIHRDGVDHLAGIWKCDDCGDDVPGYFAPRHAYHGCPHCHGNHVTFVTSVLRDWDNAQYAKEWGPNWERYRAEIAADQAEFKLADQKNRKNKQLLKEIARDFPEWDLRDGDEIRFMSVTEKNGTYVPEFVYYEPFEERTTYGTAFDPIVFVSCESKPTVGRSDTFEQICDLVRDNHNPLVKHVVFNDRGLFVADNWTYGEYKRGGIFKCPACGQVFAAADGFSKCPCCGNPDTHVINKEEKHGQE